MIPLKVRYWNPETRNFKYDIQDSKTAHKYFAQPRKYLHLCTGLKDKNGKDVYERDIVEVIDVLITGEDGDFCASLYGIVMYDNKKAQFICKFLEGLEDLCNEDSFAFIQDNYEFEVIGNIYENLGLLEDADD